MRLVCDEVTEKSLNSLKVLLVHRCLLLRQVADLYNLPAMIW
jgi:hypothetical protein